METGLGIQDKEILPNNNLAPFSAIQNFQELTAGPQGTFKVNPQGLWIGQVQIVDENGLNSLNNFRADALSSAIQVTTSSDTFTDVPGASLPPFTLTRSTIVNMSFSCFAYNNLYETSVGQEMSSMTVQLVDSVDGVIGVLVFTGIPVILLDGFLYPGAVYIDPIFYSDTTMAPLSAGTHTLKLQFRRETSGTAVINGWGINYTISGV